MKKQRAISQATVLAALYELGAVEGQNKFSWAALDRISKMVLKASGRPQTRRVGNTLRKMEADGIVQGWRVGKINWWRIKKHE